MEIGFLYAIVPSTYLFHLAMHADKFGITFRLKSTMNFPVIIGLNGEPIATPSFWVYNLFDQRELEIKIPRKEIKDLCFFTPKTHIFLMIINWIFKRMMLQWGHC